MIPPTVFATMVQKYKKAKINKYSKDIPTKRDYQLKYFHPNDISRQATPPPPRARGMGFHSMHPFNHLPIKVTRRLPYQVLYTPDDVVLVADLDGDLFVHFDLLGKVNRGERSCRGAKLAFLISPRSYV
jgi:hypothetical protein